MTRTNSITISDSITAFLKQLTSHKTDELE